MKQKNYPAEPTSYSQVPEESLYYKGEGGINLLKYKSETTMIFTSNRMLSIMSNADELYVDGTFKCFVFYYQLIIFHAYYKQFN